MIECCMNRIGIILFLKRQQNHALPYLLTQRVLSFFHFSRPLTPFVSCAYKLPSCKPLCLPTLTNAPGGWGGNSQLETRRLPRTYWDSTMTNEQNNLEISP